jgi:hypothetical protein
MDTNGAYGAAASKDIGAATNAVVNVSTYSVPAGFTLDTEKSTAGDVTVNAEGTAALDIYLKRNQYKATFGDASTDVYYEATYTAPAGADTATGIFEYWVNAADESDILKAGDTATMGLADVTYTAKYKALNDVTYVFAGTAPEGVEVPAAGKSTSFMQIQYLPWHSAYLQPATGSVNGLALGYYLPQEEINGLSLAMVHMFNQKKRGLSFSLIDVSNMFNGFALFFAGGAVDNRGCLVGIWNITESNNGIQIGIFNQAERNSLVEYPMKPEKSGKQFGVQAGLINVSDAPGIQFGLWNTNPKSIIKHFPLINICF